MSVTASVLDQVLSVILSYTGIPPAAIDVDAKIGGELGLHGGDSIEFLDEIETKFGADLTPLVEKHKTPNRKGLIRKLLNMDPTYSSDFTARQLSDFLANMKSISW